MLLVPIEWFTIEFEFDDFLTLRGDPALSPPSAPGDGPTAPTDWDPFVSSPFDVCGPPVPCGIPGIYDALAFGAPIGVGETLGGFTVIVDLPDTTTTIAEMLYFTINDPAGLYGDPDAPFPDPLDEGYATLFTPQPPLGGGGVTPIPVPAGIWLFLTGLVLVWQTRSLMPPLHTGKPLRQQNQLARAAISAG